MNLALQFRLVPVLASCCFFSLISCEVIEGPCIAGKGDVVTREVSLEPFNAINMTMSGQVTIVKGTEVRVLLTGQPNVLDEISTQVADSEWVIYPRECISNSKDLKIHITMPEVNGITLSGSGSIATEGNFEGDIRLTASGSGEVSCAGTGENAIVNFSGSGKVELSGQYTSLSVTHSGSGRVLLGGQTSEITISQSGSGPIEAYELLSAAVTVTVSGSGSSRVNASNSLDALITGSGSVFYRGLPVITVDDSGSGALVNDN